MMFIQVYIYTYMDVHSTCTCTCVCVSNIPHDGRMYNVHVQCTCVQYNIFSCTY